MGRAFDEARDSLGKANILIAGKAGVGKGTLINAVFHDQLADTGIGEPVTKTTSRISKEGVPITIWDTRGLETAAWQETRDELMELLHARRSDPDPQEHIHAAWLCILESSSRVEEAEQALCRDVARMRVPVLAVITRAIANNVKFRNEVRRLLPEAERVVRVRARAEEFAGGIEIPPMGLIELIDSTAAVLPEGQKAAWAAAQQVSVQRKSWAAQKVVIASAAAAGTAAAVPIPVANAVVLVPIQLTMLASISAIFGIDPSTEFLRMVAGIAGSGTGSVAVGSVLGRLLKFVPGLGGPGSTISAITAAVLTISLGEIYIAALVALFDKSGGLPPKPESLKDEVEKQSKAATDRSWFGDVARRARELLGSEG